MHVLKCVKKNTWTAGTVLSFKTILLEFVDWGKICQNVSIERQEQGKTSTLPIKPYNTRYTS